MANTTETATFNVKSNIGDVGKDAANAAGEFKIMGVSLNSVKAGFISAGRQAKLMFGSIKAGLISTGIGAFIVAIGSLASYFTSTKRGADQFKKALAGIGAVVTTLGDRFSKFGEGIFKIFSGKFAEGVDLLKDSFSNLVGEMTEEARVMMELEGRLQTLRDAEIAFRIEKAATRQEIERARLTAEDETKSAAERLANLKIALELEEKTTQRELELAREKVEIQELQMKVSENMVEDEAKLADLRVALIEKETASIKMRRRVITEVNALEREIQAANKKDTEERGEDMKKMPRLAGEEAKGIIQADNSVLDNYLKNNKKRKESAEANKEALQGAAVSLAGSLSSLAGDNKELAAAGALIDTYAGANKAFAQGGIAGFATGAAIIAAGLVNLQKIYSTDVPGSSGGGGGGGAAATAQAPAPQMMSGAFTLGGGQAPAPLQAFVVTDEMTNSQNQLANIRRRSSL